MTTYWKYSIINKINKNGGYIIARPKDTERRKEAFKLYRGRNTLSSIAEELGVTQPTLSKWKVEDGWDDKIEKLQGMLKARLSIKEQSNNTIILEEDEKQLGILTSLEDMILEKICSEEIEPTSWSDVVSTIRLVNEQRRLILGKPTVKTETTISVDLKGLDDGELDTKLKETQRALTLIELGEDKTTS